MQIPDQADFPIIREIQSEKDRGAAIVSAGFLDAKLTEAITACLRQDKDTSTRLFKPTGPLGAFGNKALLGYMLKLYRKETRKDFEVIAEIRNRFSHRAEPMDFGTEYIRERCQKLTLYRRFLSDIPRFEFEPRPLDAKAARHEYIQTISIAANILHHQARRKAFRERSEELWLF